MSKINIYSVEEILNYKNVNVNILTEELSNMFDSINNSFLQSTQYIENRKKINYNHLNSNKWKKINSNINTKLLSLLNKITEETFSNILEKILNSNITNDQQLNKLASDFIYKILNDNENNKLYCLMVKQIIDSGLWYFKHDTKEFINFRTFFIEKLEKEFNENINIIDNLHVTYFTNEEEYFTLKKKLVTLINTILNLHLNHILSNETMDYVVDTLKAKYSETNMDIIEFLCMINSIHGYEDVNQFLKEQLQKDKLSTRYKFMIEDLDKNVVIKKPVVVDTITEYKKFLIDGNLDQLKKKLNGKLVYIDLLKYLFDKIVSVSLNDIEKYIGYIINVKNKMDKDEYEKYLEENIDDIIEELPVLRKYIDRL